MRDISRSVAKIKCGLSEIRKRASQGKQGAIDSIKDSWMYDVLSPSPILDFDNLPVRFGGDADFPPQLSVVLPIYNVAPWLAECLRSLQAQTFTAWEAWLVDDGSHDESGAICDIFAKRDPRFHVIHQSNHGVGAARNAGIRNAKAPFLAFVDPDDILMPDYFHAQISAIKQSNAELSIAYTIQIDQYGKMVNESPLFSVPRKTHILPDNESVRNAFGEHYNCASWGMVFKRELWGSASFPNRIDLGESALCVPFVIWSAKCAVYVPKAFYAHRTRVGSLTTTITYDRMLTEIWAINYMIRTLIAASLEMTDKLENLGFQYKFSRILEFYRAQKKKGVFNFLSFCDSVLEEAITREQNGFYKQLEDQLGREKTTYNEMDSNERGKALL